MRFCFKLAWCDLGLMVMLTADPSLFLNDVRFKSPDYWFRLPVMTVA